MHAEKAARESKHCADLVEKALKSFADSAASIPRKGKKSVISFDRVFHIKKAVEAASDTAPGSAKEGDKDETEYKAMHSVFPGRIKKSVNS